MRTRSVALVDAPREFRLEEMFFSTTDRKGVITSGNSVFARVSGFTPAELVGQPHNLIRHPDMPRAAFRLLWRRLAAGQSFIGLVKNLAKDGRHYWVVAFIMPAADGYLSIRFKPSSPLLAQVEPLYARMRAAEQEHGDGGEAGRAGMDAAEGLLNEALGKLGFASYEAFMWTLMQVEMKSREAGLRGQGGGTARSGKAGTGLGVRLMSIHECGERACSQLDRLYRRLDELAGFSAELVKKSAFVTELTREIRFVALSTSLESTRLGEAGNSLGVIAHFLSVTSSQTAGEVGRLTQRIREITGELQEVSYHLSAARLQIEMVLVFCRELLDGAADAVTDERHGPAQMISALKGAFAATAGKAMQRLTSLGEHLHELNAESDDLRKTMLMLQVAQISGQVETSRVRADSAVGSIFEEVRTHVSRTSAELAELGEITANFGRLIQATPEIERGVTSSVEEMETHVTQLEALRVS